MKRMHSDGKEYECDGQGILIERYPGDPRQWLTYECMDCGHKRELPESAHGLDLPCSECGSQDYPYRPM